MEVLDDLQVTLVHRGDDRIVAQGVPAGPERDFLGAQELNRLERAPPGCGREEVGFIVDRVRRDRSRLEIKLLGEPPQQVHLPA